MLLTDHGPVGGGDHLLGARWQLDASPLGVGVLGDDGGVVPGGAGEPAAVTSLLLQAAHDGSLGHRAHGQNVANLQGSCGWKKAHISIIFSLFYPLKYNLLRNFCLDLFWVRTMRRFHNKIGSILAKHGNTIVLN